jgi:hypothetical protein
MFKCTAHMTMRIAELEAQLEEAQLLIEQMRETNALLKAIAKNKQEALDAALEAKNELV